MESMACGTPVVAFDIGGNGDMVEHQRNGYLARPFDPIDMACGIDYCLNKENTKQLWENARTKIVHSFDSKSIAKKYIEIYSTLLRCK
jgi:glycosyltransferase involved in cell wall biosynthesis